jgi:MFS transporter, ACDE family, multidrug resistance protein
MLITGVVSSRIGPKRTLLLGLVVIITEAPLLADHERLRTAIDCACNYFSNTAMPASSMIFSTIATSSG